MVSVMRGFFIFVLCLACFAAGGWVVGPWLMDRAVDRFVARVSSDPKLAAHVVTALVSSPAFREAVTQELKNRGFDLDKIDVQRLQQSFQAMIALTTSPEFQKYMVEGLRKRRINQPQTLSSGDLKERLDLSLTELKKRLASVADSKTIEHTRADIERKIKELWPSKR